MSFDFMDFRSFLDFFSCNFDTIGSIFLMQWKLTILIYAQKFGKLADFINF